MSAREHDPEMVERIALVIAHDVPSEPMWSCIVIAKRVLDAVTDDLLPEAINTVEQWGVRCREGIYAPVSEGVARSDVGSARHHPRLVCNPRLIRSTRTSYADHVTEWEEVS